MTPDYDVHGDGPVLLLFGHPRPPRGPLGAPSRRLNVVLRALADRYRVVLVEYPGSPPRPTTLTPAAATADLLAVADAVGADRFAWWGYSWGAVLGIQLAATAPDRLTALACGGFPPRGGPYREMLTLSRTYADRLARLRLPARMRRSVDQYVTYYEGLQGFDDGAVAGRLPFPKLCYVGSEDRTRLRGEELMSMATIVGDQRPALEADGWTVRIVEGRNHRQGLQPDVFAGTVAPWLDSVLLS